MQSKQILIALAMLFLLGSQNVSARMLEVEVHGMTCAFCVDSLKRNLSKHPDIEKVKISLKHEKVQLTTRDNAPSVETIRQLILDVGFTPVHVRLLNHEKD